MTRHWEGPEVSHIARHPRQATELCVILGGMTDDLLDDLRTCARSFRRAEAILKSRRDTVYLGIIAASNAGIPQKQIVEATGFTREHIRRIVADGHKDLGTPASSADAS